MPLLMVEEIRDLPALVAKVREGDEDAARDLLNRLHPLVLKLVRSHLPRRTLEEDLVQATFVKVFGKLDQYSGQVPLEHWVSRITINTCLNQIQNEKVRKELRYADLSEEEEQVISSLATHSDDLDPGESVASRELLEKLLESLSPADRLVVTMLHLEGRSLDEVRASTGWNIPLIKVRAFRARHKLRKLLNSLMMESEHER